MQQSHPLRLNPGPGVIARHPAFFFDEQYNKGKPLRGGLKWPKRRWFGLIGAGRMHVVRFVMEV